LADQLSKAGWLDEAFEGITKALALAEQTGEGYVVSELHLIKGELFLTSGKLIKAGKLPGGSSELSTQMQARACFAEALTVAKRQRTKYWELKAALSMYRLDLMLGNSNHNQLAEIYSSFTEGFETQDLRAAKAILDGNAVPANAR